MQLELLPSPAPQASTSTALAHLLEVERIYLEPAVRAHARGRDILARFPKAEQLEVASHANIPGLHGNAGNVEAWNRVKGSTLVLGVKKGLRFEPNGRSADFLPPSAANGCVMSCAYCYVPRNKGYANPVTVFVNIEDIVGAVRRHAGRLGPKVEPNTVDPRHWVYDIGCNSPVVLTDTWREDWDALFQQVDAAIGERTRAQLACEVILLTHHDGLHQVNLGWHPKAEALLWRPELQEAKPSKGLGTTVRYRTGLKGRAVEELEALLARRMPYCRVRYAF